MWHKTSIMVESEKLCEGNFPHFMFKKHVLGLLIQVRVRTRCLDLRYGSGVVVVT